MRIRTIVVLAAVATTLLSPAFAMAQKGVGDPTGIAREPVKPALKSLTGTLTSVETHPCQKTTGRAPVGTHILLKTSKDKTFNVHLGPADAEVIEEAVKEMSVGQEVNVIAFRTEKMPELNFVAVLLKFGDTTVILRDDAFRPVWAGKPLRGGQQGGRAGYGRGYGRGRGRDWRRN